MMAMTPNLPPHASLADLQSLNSDSAYYSSAVSFKNIREQAIREAALTLGTQAGLAYESAQIDQVLASKSAVLDHIFDFNQVMYRDNVLPPVLNTATNLVNINPSGSIIRIAGVTYTILAPARFVTSPPTWRDYLWLNYPQPELPDKSLLPENSAEQAIWKQNITIGWHQGISQAVSIFGINLSNLVQNFNGMILYKELLLKNMVSPYAVERTEKGITGNGHHMVIDDQEIQLTTQPELLPNSSKLWQALPVGENTPKPESATETNNNTSNLVNALEKAVESNATSTSTTSHT